MSADPTPVVVTVAPTGPLTTRDEHPDLPLTPEEIGIAVSEAAEAGASVAHIHARDGDGKPTAEVAVYESIISEIRKRCDVVIQVSTGVGLDVSPAERLRIIADRPPATPMATLNVASMTFAGGTFANPPWMVKELAEALVRHEIKPELEIYDTGHLDLALRVVRESGIETPLMFSFVMGVSGGMPAEVDLLAHLTRGLPERSSWQVIGIGRHQFRLLLAGLSLSGNVRVGFEDNVFLRAGVKARDNAELVGRAVALIQGAGKSVATPDQARETLGVEL